MYLKEILRKYAYIRKYAMYAFVVFVVSIFAGYYTTTLNTEQMRLIFSDLMEDSSILNDVGPITLFLVIFFNNTIKSFFILLIGTLFGILPMLFIVANGYLLGITSYFVIEELGFAFLVLGIVPHGIIEIPLLVLIAAYGLWLGDSFIRKISHKENLKQKIRITLRVFFRYFVPLFFFAAFIEVFITDLFLTLTI